MHEHFFGFCDLNLQIRNGLIPPGGVRRRHRVKAVRERPTCRANSVVRTPPGSSANGASGLGRRFRRGIFKLGDGDPHAMSRVRIHTTPFSTPGPCCRLDEATNQCVVGRAPVRRQTQPQLVTEDGNLLVQTTQDGRFGVRRPTVSRFRFRFRVVFFHGPDTQAAESSVNVSTHFYRHCFWRQRFGKPTAPPRMPMKPTRSQPPSSLAVSQILGNINSKSYNAM